MDDHRTSLDNDLDFLAGQMAAMETLLQAIFSALPDKLTARDRFIDEAASALVSMPKADMPEPARVGYAMRADAIREWTKALLSTDEAPPRIDEIGVA